MTDKLKDDSLLPCPFCGCNPIAKSIEMKEFSCPNHHTKRLDKSTWNTRADLRADLMTNKVILKILWEELDEKKVLKYCDEYWEGNSSSYPVFNYGNLKVFLKNLCQRFGTPSLGFDLEQILPKEIDVFEKSPEGNFRDGFNVCLREIRENYEKRNQ